MDAHAKYISEYDEGIFTDDYQPGARERELFLLPELDFRKVWDLLSTADGFDDALRSSTKKSIFNHLQTIYISASMALDQIGAFNKNMEKQKALLLNMIENLKLGDEVKKRMAEMKQTEDAASAKSASSGIPGLSSLLSGLGGATGGGIDITSMFGGEDNFVFQLAKDIVGELDMGNDEIDSPMDSIMSLFANDGKKMQELIVKVGDKLEQKIASGEVDKDRLFKDAKAMKDKLAAVAPGLGDMINDSGFTAPLKAHYESLSDEDKQAYADIPNILEKPFGSRTEDENARCFSMPGLNVADFQTAMAGMMGSEETPKAKANEKAKAKAKARSK
jgi:hypothetical protein